jgi:hypothetical protein
MNTVQRQPGLHITQAAYSAIAAAAEEEEEEDDDMRCQLRQASDFQNPKHTATVDSQLSIKIQMHLTCLLKILQPAKSCFSSVDDGCNPTPNQQQRKAHTACCPLLCQ